MSKYWFGEFIYDLRTWGWATAWWNLRFNWGLRIGGFTQATRGERK